MSIPRSAFRTPHSLLRPLVRALHPYVPGEQPKIKGLVKLNTNENPYPPAPAVLQAIRAATDGRLRLYPNPTAQPLREALAKFHRCKPSNLIVGNGSDELLAMAVRAFVEPQLPEFVTGMVPDEEPAAGPFGRPFRSRCTVQYFTPSYSLYPVLADSHGARRNAVPLGADFALPSVAELQCAGQWDFHAALTFITTPNAPSGRGYTMKELDALCRAQSGVVVLDEAYVDFADSHALRLALRHPHVLVARTFSKAYSLCFLRVGYFVGHPQLIGALDKIRDSYNVNGLGQAAGLATLKNLPYYRAKFRRIIATRQRLAGELAARGFHVWPSQTNFLLVRPPGGNAAGWGRQLRARKVLVRWFAHPGIEDCLRISIGSDAETDALLRAVRSILRH